MPPFKPRQYQSNAVQSLYTWFSAGRGNPLIVAPTGSGKSVIQAVFAKQAIDDHPNTRIIMASHVKELLTQNGDWLTNLGLTPGYLSAGLNQRDFKSQVLVAGIQTAYKHAARVGWCDLMIIDEAHLLSDKKQSMYQDFIAGLKKLNPYLRLIGLTATPYRMSSGLLYGKPDSMFDGIAYDIPIKTLIDQGHLCRLTGRRGVTHVDLSKVHIRGGEFKADELEQAFDLLTANICDEIIAASTNSKGVLIFASGVKHAHHIAEYIHDKTGYFVGCVSGKTPKKERDTILNNFKANGYKYLVNMGVLTTGFDAPHIDLIALCRATKSTGLYVQICGRGMRTAPNKSKCVVMDYGGNIERHGPIDKIDPRDKSKSNKEGEAPIKECPKCLALIHMSIMECPDCGYIFPAREPDLDKTASNAAIMSDEAIETISVDSMRVFRHTKKNKPDSMRVDYYCGLNTFSEWVCFNHTGYPRRKAEMWANRRGYVPPASVDDALLIPWPETVRLTVNTSGRFPEILDYQMVGRPYNWDQDQDQDQPQSNIEQEIKEDSELWV